MRESLDDAKMEMRRVDHLIYVSLKYTRTVDMLRHVVQRHITCFEFLIETLLKYAKEKKKLDDVPANPGTRLELLKKIFHKDEKLMEFAAFYSKLRKIMLAGYSKTREYRRHVAMITEIDGEQIEINIDKVGEYYVKAKEYLEYVEGMIEGKKK